MPNTLGTLASAVIIQRALALVNTKRPLLKRISLDLSDQRVKFGQSVISRLNTLPAVGNFGDAADAAVLTDVPVTVNQFKQIFKSFTQAEMSSTDRNLIDEQADPIAAAMANYFVDQVAALYTAGNFANETTVADAWSRANTVIPLRTALSKRGAPGDLFASVNSDVYGSLLSDPMIVSILNNSAGSITSGSISPVDGFQISEYPALPTTGNLVGFAGSADACVIATRVPTDPREQLPSASYPGNYGVVTDPTTGLSVVVNEWISPTDNSANIRLCWMMGVAVGNPNNGQRLITA